MFETANRKSLDEETFEEWLEKGRDDLLGFQYLIILWNEWENEYKPVYSGSREEAGNYRTDSREEIISIYDIYSESRVR